MTCPMCDRIKQAASDPLFIAELETGIAFLFDFQFYPGYTLFVSKSHAAELFDFPDAEDFMSEMGKVARAVHEAFRPRKLNYELLGNVAPHLHWHIIPRYEDDPAPKAPIWTLDEAVRQAPETRPDEARIRTLAAGILAALTA